MRRKKKDKDTLLRQTLKPKSLTAYSVVWSTYSVQPEDGCAHCTGKRPRDFFLKTMAGRKTSQRTSANFEISDSDDDDDNEEISKVIRNLDAKLQEKEVK